MVEIKIVMSAGLTQRKWNQHFYYILLWSYYWKHIGCKDLPYWWCKSVSSVHQNCCGSLQSLCQI